MKIQSPSFDNNSNIPDKYTMHGENINPPLEVSDVPESAQSLVLIVDDPDAPSGLWIHWTLWNIDPKTNLIKENSVPEGAVQGKTSRENHYSGPKPPSGTHRYFFKLYALDTKLDLPETADIEALMNAMQNHIIDQAELIGLYSAIE